MEFTLESGAVLDVTMADFVDSNSLRKAIMRASKDFEIGKDAIRGVNPLTAGTIGSHVANDHVDLLQVFRCCNGIVTAGH